MVGILTVVAKRKVGRDPFPWLALLLLIVTFGLFWLWPRRVGSPPVRVEFTEAKPAH